MGAKVTAGTATDALIFVVNFCHLFYVLFCYYHAAAYPTLFPEEKSYVQFKLAVPSQLPQMKITFHVVLPHQTYGTNIPGNRFEPVRRYDMHNLPRSGRQKKATPQATRNLVREAKKSRRKPRARAKCHTC